MLCYVVYLGVMYVVLMVSTVIDLISDRRLPRIFAVYIKQLSDLRVNYIAVTLRLY